jgi:hypothetical protein
VAKGIERLIQMGALRRALKHELAGYRDKYAAVRTPQIIEDCERIATERPEMTWPTVQAYLRREYGLTLSVSEKCTIAFRRAKRRELRYRRITEEGS